MIKRLGLSMLSSAKIIGDRRQRKFNKIKEKKELRAKRKKKAKTKKPAKSIS